MSVSAAKPISNVDELRERVCASLQPWQETAHTVSYVFLNIEYQILKQNPFLDLFDIKGNKEKEAVRYNPRTSISQGKIFFADLHKNQSLLFTGDFPRIGAYEWKRAFQLSIELYHKDGRLLQAFKYQVK